MSDEEKPAKSKRKRVRKGDRVTDADAAKIRKQFFDITKVSVDDMAAEVWKNRKK